MAGLLSYLFSICRHMYVLAYSTHKKTGQKGSNEAQSRLIWLHLSFPELSLFFH